MSGAFPRPLLWLASRSPRRRLLLSEAGVEVLVQPPGIDDATVKRGRVSSAQWVMSLAYLKARSVHDQLLAQGIRQGHVLAADTVCVCGESLFGQPLDADEARAMLVAMRKKDHETMTGVCVLSLSTSGRWTIVDRATVRVGFISDEEIEGYIESQEWRAKAGGYNLFDRIQAGWPLECLGDPATVVGLPMRRLRPWLDRMGIGAA